MVCLVQIAITIPSHHLQHIISSYSLLFSSSLSSSSSSSSSSSLTHDEVTVEKKNGDESGQNALESGQNGDENALETGDERGHNQFNFVVDTLACWGEMRACLEEPFSNPLIVRGNMDDDMMMWSSPISPHPISISFISHSYLFDISLISSFNQHLNIISSPSHSLLISDQVCSLHLRSRCPRNGEKMM